jgi:hypothetical protein
MRLAYFVQEEFNTTTHPYIAGRGSFHDSHKPVSIIYLYYV